MIYLTWESKCRYLKITIIYDNYTKLQKQLSGWLNSTDDLQEIWIPDSQVEYFHFWEEDTSMMRNSKVRILPLTTPRTVEIWVSDPKKIFSVLRAYVPCTCGDPRRVWDALEQESQMLVNHHWGLGTEPDFSAIAASALNSRTRPQTKNTFSEIPFSGVYLWHTLCVCLCLSLSLCVYEFVHTHM